MGVRGLWKLLLPIGRRISVETLEGKILAIDASIWLAQFLQAMRDPDTGSIKEAAHLIGFFRRLAKLRFHGIKPVLVFDGATPEIKLREIQARRQKREQFASQGPQGIQRLAKRLLVQELKKRKGGSTKDSQGGMATTFNLPEEELKGKTTEVNREDKTQDETSEQIAMALQEEEWNTPNDESEVIENDWDDVIPTTDAQNDDEIKDVSLDTTHILQHLSSMSAHARKDAIEEAKRRQRLQSRREFMPVAGQPEEYSQVQLRNFLRSTRLHKSIFKLANEAAAKDNQLGEAVASDATRRIVFEKFDEKFETPSTSKPFTRAKQKLMDPSDCEDEILVESENTTTRGDDSVEDEEIGAGFFRESSSVKSGPAGKNLSLLESDDSLNQHSGSLFDANQNDVVQIHSDVERTVLLTDTAEAQWQKSPFQSNHLSLTQEIEDEMLARAIQESEERDDNVATFATIEKNDTHSDEALARQLQDYEHANQNPSDYVHDVEDSKEHEDDQKLPARVTQTLIVVDSDGDGDEDVDWEDCDDMETEHGVIPDSTCHASPENVDDEDSKVDWEEGEEINETTSLPSSTTPIREISKVEGFDVNDYGLPTRNRNEAALEQAQATAANLTNWAGRAFRRAIAAHAEATGHPVEQVPRPSVTIAPVNMIPTQNDELPGMTANALFQANSEKSSENIGNQDGHDQKERSIAVDAQIASDSKAPFLPMDMIPKIGSTTLLLDEEDILDKERKHDERDMETATDEMKAEIIQLIQLFGIPYVEAPAEAEAQCAALEALGLVDGIVTEDSDVFVFGGQTIYRHIFDDQKYVEVYLSSDAARDLSLNRNQFVGLAMLLGGDYTDGVKGVGIVNGMEILQAFDLNDGVKAGLTNFRKWLDGFDPGDTFGNTDASYAQSPERKFHIKHRSARQRWSAPTNFPSEAVLNAYINPVVDTSEDKFSWGTPDLDALIDFCKRNMGWEAGDTQAIIRPIMERINAGMRQTRIESFFMTYEDNIKFANIKSKRLREVFHGIQGEKMDNRGRESPKNKAGDLDAAEGLGAHTAEVEQGRTKRRKTTSKRGRPRGVK